MRRAIRSDLSVSIEAGDILEAATEAIAVTANPGFQLTGGIGALLMAKGGATYQAMLNAAARQRFGGSPAPRGSILVVPGAPLAARFLLHVVSIDVFYRTTADVLAACTRDCLLAAEERGCGSLALPAFATGYGRFGLEPCARAMAAGILEVGARLTAVRRVEIWLRDRCRRERFTSGWSLPPSAP